MGNALFLPRAEQFETVHPHVHGERRGRSSAASRPNGSSPRTWGTLQRFRCRPATARFIPTYMGNAQQRSAAPVTVAVHPHVHGERRRQRRYLCAGVGSSPRTWGTRDRRALQNFLLRFIPTYMGNASRHHHMHRYRPVHPHVHGERAASRAVWSESIGSSPRTWGTLYVPETCGVVNRFIPTYMGNAEKPGPRYWLWSVHPHVHGERALLRKARSITVGSSPRTWGTQR